MSINTKKYIEKYLKIKTKDSNIIPFTLNNPQNKLYDIIKELKKQHKPVRIIILKARQMGFSTLTEAILFKETATKRNMTAGIVTHQEDATNNLYNMSRLYYSELPNELKPQILNSNAKELVFNTKENNGLNSRIRCMTAGSSGVGRSGTYNILHLSEFAFWSGDKKSTLNGLMQAVPNNDSSIVIIESTANGYEFFKELWDDAVAGTNDFVPVFLAWYELPEYSMPYNGFELTKEEQTIKEQYNLSNEQLAWRRWCIRNNCGNDIDQFHQEYPISPEEAFIASGNCYFDKKNIIDRINELRVKPIEIIKGRFNYSYKNEKILTYNFEHDQEGFIDIYELPKDRVPYVIGADTAGEGSDYFTACVINNMTGKQVAKVRKQFDETEFTRQMYCLGKFYNNALIGLEANFSTYPIKELERLDYRNQFVREYEDTFTNKNELRLGFKTTAVTRPLVLAILQSIIKENIDRIVDIDTLKECLDFVRNEKGRPEAVEGKHDDLVLCTAITYYVREQQSFKLLKEEVKQVPVYDSFMQPVRTQITEDFGSEIEII